MIPVSQKCLIVALTQKVSLTDFLTYALTNSLTHFVTYVLTRTADTMIISSEKNRFDDFCYHKKYYLSIKAQRDKYPNYLPLNETVENYPHPHYHYDLLHRLIINWGIFSMPQHLILTRTIENLVHFLTLEYFHESASHITQPYALKAMTVFCATRSIYAYIEYIRRHGDS